MVSKIGSHSPPIHNFGKKRIGTNRRGKIILSRRKIKSHCALEKRGGKSEYEDLSLEGTKAGRSGRGGKKEGETGE